MYLMQNTNQTLAAEAGWVMTNTILNIYPEFLKALWD